MLCSIPLRASVLFKWTRVQPLSACGRREIFCGKFLQRLARFPVEPARR
jgi:hypothetical protein